MTERSTARRMPRRRWLVVAAIAVVAAIGVGGAIWAGVSTTATPVAPTVPTPQGGGVGGYLFQDRDGDGVRGPGEPALSGWDVRVYSTGPLPLDTTATDTDGVFVLDTIDDATPGETTARIRVQPAIEGPAAANMPTPSALSQEFTIPLGETAAIPVAAFRACLAQDQCTDLRLPDLVPQLTSSGGEE
ncbi:hypothetical protein [Microbacterium paraoxydans]|uniref:hypothetical protein n=1 Tax=Microbacterium paraoxydans TaxID=199592 RepID=UPI001CFA225E|nr:hypothetical protein [Microbacterium paraoxydans]